MPESLRGRIGADDAARAFARRTPAGSSRRGFCAQVGLAVLGLAVGLPESAAVADMPAKLPLPAGFRYPNGVAAAPDGTLFVGSVVGGQVLRRAPGFDRWDTLFAGSEAIFASTTLRLDVDRNLLWGASPDFLGSRQPDGTTRRRPHRIYCLDAGTGAVRRVLMMPEGGFGNDLTLDAGGNLYLTDSARNRVLFLPRGGDAFRTLASDERFAANGAALPAWGLPASRSPRTAGWRSVSSEPVASFSLSGVGPPHRRPGRCFCRGR